WNNEDEFIYECWLDVANVEDLSQTEVVAFANDYDDYDISLCRVDNSAICRSIDWKDYAGIKAINSDINSRKFYNLEGLQVSESYNGIIIMITSDSYGNIHREKIIRQ
ncbi:MAG: hypothetical protein K2G23_02095, partial [Muribaculaceae bacterium]|nr:hypothetical protein [Muribaculaceae bacterium]